MQRRAERWNGELDGLMDGWMEGGCTWMEERSRVLTKRRRRNKNTAHPRLFPRRPSDQQPLRPHLHLIPAPLPLSLSRSRAHTRTRSLPLPRHVCRGRVLDRERVQSTVSAARGCWRTERASIPRHRVNITRVPLSNSRAGFSRCAPFHRPTRLEFTEVSRL